MTMKGLHVGVGIVVEILQQSGESRPFGSPCMDLCGVLDREVSLGPGT